MQQRTLIWVAALNFAVTGMACSSARGNERDADMKANRSGETVTIAGCLSSGADGRFALTAAPDAAVSTTARAMDDERDTYSYVLIGGDNLPAHLGKRVEVTGTLAGGTQDLEQQDTTKTESAPVAGNTPTVKTKEEIDLEVRQLTVREVRDLAPTCVVNP